MSPSDSSVNALKVLAASLKIILPVESRIREEIVLELVPVTLSTLIRPPVLTSKLVEAVISSSSAPEILISPPFASPISMERLFVPVNVPVAKAVAPPTSICAPCSVAVLPAALRASKDKVPVPSLLVSARREILPEVDVKLPVISKESAALRLRFPEAEVVAALVTMLRLSADITLLPAPKVKVSVPPASSRASRRILPTVEVTFSATLRLSMATASIALASSEPVIVISSAESRYSLLIDAAEISTPEFILISPVPWVTRESASAAISTISPVPSSSPPPPVVTIFTLFVAVIVALALPAFALIEAKAPISTSDAMMEIVSAAPPLPSAPDLKVFPALRVKVPNPSVAALKLSPVV